MFKKSFHESYILYQQCQCLVMPENSKELFFFGVCGNHKVSTSSLHIHQSLYFYILLTFIHDNLYFLKFLNISFNLQNMPVSQDGQELLLFYRSEN